MSETEALVDAGEQPTAEELKGVKRAAEVRVDFKSKKADGILAKNAGSATLTDDSPFSS